VAGEPTLRQFIEDRRELTESFDDKKSPDPAPQTAGLACGKSSLLFGMFPARRLGGKGGRGDSAAARRKILLH
jgi:hypothetical protein